MTRITLARIGANETVKYAVGELADYLKKIDNELFVDIRTYGAYDATVKNVIWVGTDAAFESLLLPVEDKKLDDSILIDIENGAGILTGSNPRAVLIAAYRLLRELGVAWIRPTDDGEIIPHYTVSDITVSVKEKASYRHRAICIEGATSYEHVLNMLKWIPRVGMSGYFFQFPRPFTFFDRWYSHEANPLLANENVSREDVNHIVAALKEEVEKRGLLYHAMGHGWTCEPFGFLADGWDKMKDEDIPEKSRQYLAEIDGKRTFFGGVPLNTNLCYSNPEVRSIITSAITDYCKQHNEVEYVHFWLADATNNHCTCKNCAERERPSDYFVMMLNELDERLTAEGLDTKVVFLVYYDLFWMPLQERFKKHDRFVLMFAPITRTYSESFADFDPSMTYPHSEFKKNDCHISKRVSENLGLLQDWRTVYQGDSFDFDYHLVWDHYRDLGYFGIAKTMFEDMKALSGFGLNGMVSCQMTRAFFPHNLPMQMMADALWDNTCDFEIQSSKYFATAFGCDGEAVKSYMRTVSELLSLPEIRGDVVESAATVLENYQKLSDAIAKFQAVIERNLAAGHVPAVEKSWQYLTYHTEMLTRYIAALTARAEGNEEARAAASDALIAFIRENEVNIHKVYDVWQAVFMLADAVKNEHEYKKI